MRKFSTPLLIAFFLFFSCPSFSQYWTWLTKLYPGIPSQNVVSLAVNDSNRIYAATKNGLAYFEDSTWHQQNIGYMTYVSMYRVWVTGDSLWAGTEYDGLWGFYNNAWKNYDPNTAGNGIVGFGRTSSDSLYRLDKFSRFSAWNGSEWTPIVSYVDQPNNLFVDKQDNVWALSNNMGMVQYNHGVITRWQNNISSSDPHYIPSGSIFDMIQDSVGIYWIASNSGLLRFDGSKFQVFNKANSGIASNSTRCIALDKNGVLWIGTRDSGLCKYDGTKWTTYNLQNSPQTSLIINDVMVDSSNNIWIANGYNEFISPSYGQGIFVFDQNKDVSNGMLPNAPQNLIGTVVFENRIDIKWSDFSNNESGFELQRSINDSLHFIPLKTFTANDTLFIDRTTLAGKTYYYKVRAFNNIGFSGYSNTITIQPKYCPVNETSYGAYAIVKKVVFGNIDNEINDCISGYRNFIDQSTTLFAGQTLMLTVAFDRCNITSDPIIGGVAYIDWNGDGDFADAQELVFSNINIDGKGEFNVIVNVPSFVKPGTKVRLRVRASSHVYSSSISSCGSAETTHDYSINIKSISNQNKPSNLVVTPLTANQISLLWQDNSASEINYSIERSIDSINFVPVAILPSNTILYKDSLLKPDTKYYYRVKCILVNSNVQGEIKSGKTLPADLVKQLIGDIATYSGFNVGAYWVDYNNDGKYDLYAPGLNVLFKNVDSTLNNSQLQFISSSTSTWADYDNDGDQDVYITGDLYSGFSSESILYINNGNGSFTPNEIFVPDGRINNCVWTDYNKDGYVDLYVSYIDNLYGKLYRNNGGKTFTMVQKFDNASGYASFADYDNDGDDDLVVVGGYLPSAVFELKDTLFTRTYSTNISNILSGTRGVSWADYDNDGKIDLFIANPNDGYSTLYRNLGSGIFSGSIFTNPLVDGDAYGSAWADYDNDGYQDLFISRYAKTSKLLRNINGVFTEIPATVFRNEDYSTFPYDERSSMGCAWADYNNDGFLDLYVAENSGIQSDLYLNGTNENHWIQFLLKGKVSDANAIGAKIKLKANGKWQYRWIQNGSGFSADNSITVEFGLANASIVDSIIINWPSGLVQTLTNLGSDKFYIVNEDAVLSLNDIYLEGQLNNKSVILKWTSQHGNDINYFDVEKSTDGVNFKVIGKVNGSNLLQYTYTDLNAFTTTNVIYYRVVAIQNNNKKEYSKIISFNKKQLFKTITIFPNPVAKIMILNINENLTNADLKLYSVDGKLLYRIHQNLLKGEAINVPVSNLNNGMYLLSVDATETKESFKIIVAH